MNSWVPLIGTAMLGFSTDRPPLAFRRFSTQSPSLMSGTHPDTVHPDEVAYYESIERWSAAEGDYAPFRGTEAQNVRYCI